MKRALKDELGVPDLGLGAKADLFELRQVHFPPAHSYGLNYAPAKIHKLKS